MLGPKEHIPYAYPMRYTCNKCEIWVNPDEKSIKEVLDMENKHHHRMHVFISRATIVMNDSFKRFLEAFFYNPTDIPTLTIHISKKMPDLKVVLYTIIDDLDLPEWSKPRIRIVAEREGAWFTLDRRWPWHYTTFEWHDDVLDVAEHLTVHDLSGYEINYRAYGGKPGAIRNLIQRAYPYLFKDKIVAGFKEACPPGILKSFRDDEDIWDYILQEGEWKEGDDDGVPSVEKGK